MLPIRHLIAWSLVILALSLTLLAVLMVFVLAAESLADPQVATVLRWIAGGVVLIATVDLLLLVLALGWQAVGGPTGDDERAP